MSLISYRSMAERITHRVVLHRRLTVADRRIHLYVSSEGGLRYLRPNLPKVDPGLLRLAREVVRPGSVVWDIGANVGLFTFAAASLAGPAGQVLAIEPDTWLVGLLHRSVAANRDTAPVQVLPVAVSDRVGVGRFHIARRSRSTNYLDGFGTTQTGGSRGTQAVPTVTLDWLAAHFPPPDVIKIDVERAESLVLAGASAVLSARPVMICEVAAANATTVRDTLSPFGYSLYDGDVTADCRRPLDRVPPALLAMPTTDRTEREPAPGRFT